MQGVVGIDPGAKGAIALLDASNRDASGVPELMAVEAIPTSIMLIGGRKSPVVDGLKLAQLLWSWEREHRLTIAKGAVERVAAMPNDRAPQAFAFGRSLGAVSAVVQAQGIAVEFVPVSVWRQTVGVPKIQDDTGERRKLIKAVCRKRAQELWPRHADWFKRVKDTDAAEAAMIALSIC